MVDLLLPNGHLTETQYLDAKISSIQFCDKQCFNNSCHNKKNNMSTEDRISDIKSVHVGHHHVCQGEILAEFLKITYGVIRSELSLNWEGAC